MAGRVLNVPRTHLLSRQPASTQLGDVVPSSQDRFSRETHFRISVRPSAAGSVVIASSEASPHSAKASVAAGSAGGARGRARAPSRGGARRGRGGDGGGGGGSGFGGGGGGGGGASAHTQRGSDYKPEPEPKPGLKKQASLLHASLSREEGFKRSPNKEHQDLLRSMDLSKVA